MFFLIVAGILGYLLGSFPTAYLFVRWKSRIDIRNAGSGNVGALNSYEVSGSRLLGGAVLLIDLLKGVVASTFVGKEFGFAGTAMAGLGAVLGHNFPIWLHFRGGRGLATAAGVVVVLSWPLVGIWVLFWLLGFMIWKEVNVGNAVACCCSLALILALPDHVLSFFPQRIIPINEFRWFLAALLLILSSRLVEPLIEFVRKRKRIND